MASTGMIVLGRVLLGLYFLVPGIMKFLSPEMHVALIETHRVPFASPLMWVAAVVNVAGGLALIAGIHVRRVALGFVIYILLVNAMLHDFWNFPDELQNFIKNLGILAGLLVLAGHARIRALRVGDVWKRDSQA